MVLTTIVIVICTRLWCNVLIHSYYLEGLSIVPNLAVLILTTGLEFKRRGSLLNRFHYALPQRTRNFEGECFFYSVLDCALGGCHFIFLKAYYYPVKALVRDELKV